MSLLAETVDQFVIHYDACGLSQTCFDLLQDQRDLSVHFMLDLDGTIYQTLDVKERAWHATIANTRAIGIEIANVGAYPETGYSPLRFLSFFSPLLSPVFPLSFFPCCFVCRACVFRAKPVRGVVPTRRGQHNQDRAAPEQRPPQPNLGRGTHST